MIAHSVPCQNGLDSKHKLHSAVYQKMQTITMEVS